MQRIIFFLFFISTIIYSQELTESNRLLLENFKKGNYAVALGHAEKSLQLTENIYGKNNDIYISALNSLAFIYDAMDSLNSAWIVFEEALEIAFKNNLFAKSGLVSIKGLAQVKQKMDDFGAALSLFEKALIICEKNKIPEIPERLAILKDAAELQDYVGNLDKAENLYLEAISILEKYEQTKEENYTEISGALASVYRRLGKYTKSEFYYKKSVDLLKNSNHFSPKEYAYLLNGWGNLYHNLSKYDEAEKLYSESLELRKNIYGNESVDYAQSLNNLALLYDDIGKPAEAEKMYKTVLKIWEKEYGKQSPIYAITLNNMAVLFGKMGRTEEAMNYFLESLNIRKSFFGESSLSYANSLNNSAALLKNMGYYEGAAKLLKNALKLFEEKLDRQNPLYIVSLSNLASVYDVMGKYDDAERMYLEALNVRKNVLGVKSSDYANSLHNLGILYYRKNDFKKADSILTEAVNLRKEILGEKHFDYIFSVSNLARLKEGIGDVKTSKKLWIHSLDLYVEKIKQVFPFLSEKEKNKFYLAIKEKFEMFNSFVQRNYTSDPDILNNLVNYQFEIKGLLLNSIAKMRQRVLNSPDKNLKMLYYDWITVKEQLAALYLKNAVSISEQTALIDSLEKSANEYEREISLKSEVTEATSDLNDTPVKRIKRFLKPEEAALEVIRFRRHNQNWSDSVCYAFLLIKPEMQTPEIIYLENGNLLERDYYTDYINLIRSRINDKVSFRRFIEPFFSKLSGIRKLYYSPDGVYNKINLSSLKRTDNSYPADDIDITIITGMKDLFKSGAKALPISRVTLFGNPDFKSAAIAEDRDIIAPLPGTEKEIKNIKKIFDIRKIKCDTFLKSQANTENLKKQKNPAILHIATHGFFREDITAKENKNNTDESNNTAVNPLLRSGLILSGSEFFTAYEAMNMDLDSTLLVTLSACETGLGEINNGEGVYGLQRALITAGAGNIIMSLWKVSDEVTTELMTSFYEYFLNDKDIRKAFKKAQFEVRSKYKDPLYWGAFVILGL